MKLKKLFPNNIFLIFLLLASTLFAVGACRETGKLKAGPSGSAVEEVKGPYTVFVLSGGVYRIEDANDKNPAGMEVGKDGKLVRMNNCSDMYLLVGESRALLIDLSNDVRWDDRAAESLLSIVYERTGERGLTITASHNHGDHLGMLPAFEDDPRADFWVPEAEFADRRAFPMTRTVYFPKEASLDLGGGFIVDTLELPGHTAHSTVFFLRGRNLAFTGDAIGSGSGVWLFDYESFLSYRDGIEKLIAYFENRAHHIDLDLLQIHGGHAWQRGDLPVLPAQYVYDMRTLIERMGQGTAGTEAISVQIPFLDTNFKYGLATITWNKMAGARYAESMQAE